jgi:hypothetical protein
MKGLRYSDGVFFARPMIPDKKAVAVGSDMRFKLSARTERGAGMLSIVFIS